MRNYVQLWKRLKIKKSNVVFSVVCTLIDNGYAWSQWSKCFGLTISEHNETNLCEDLLTTELARPTLCKSATCTRETCLSKAIFIPGIWPVSGFVIVKNKLTWVFRASCLLLRSSYGCQSLLRNHELQACSSTTTLTMLWRIHYQ